MAGPGCTCWATTWSRIGFVIGLDYPNPWLSPFDEFQRFKTPPGGAPQMLEGGKRIAYGARALNEGGFQAIPKLVFPGGMLIGDAAGFLNVPKIKGTHTSMKSGMVAAEAVAAALAGEGAAAGARRLPGGAAGEAGSGPSCRACATSAPASPSSACGAGMVNAALDTYVFRGKAPWTMAHHADHETLKKAGDAPTIAYPKPDGVLSLRPAFLGVPVEHQP